MKTNEVLITNFYKAFQNKDYQTMQNSYGDNAVFNDEVFKNLNAKEVRAMWEMLIKSGKDLTLEFMNVEADDAKGSAEWIATYTFSKTGRKVVNHVKASFFIEDDKIVRHTDQFDFYFWTKQALGLPGLLMGWSSFLRKKVQDTARKSLSDYIGKLHKK